MYNEFDQNITKESDPVSADTIHIDIVIRTFHPVSVSSFFIQNNRKITECIFTMHVPMQRLIIPDL